MIFEDSKQEVKEWLKKVMPEGEVTSERRKRISVLSINTSQRQNWDFSQSVLSKSAMMTSLSKFNLFVFDGDPCAWPDWYGMFKALVHDQELSRTQKMIHLKASVKGQPKKLGLECL